MSLPSYTDLVESESELTARRPRSWREARIKSLLRQVTDKAEGSDWKLALENIESWTGRLLESTSQLEGDGIEFREGDVLFGKLRPYLAKVFTAPRSGAAVGDFLVLRPQADLRPQFLRYLLASPPVIDNLSATAEGAKMPRTSWLALSRLVAPFPSTEEQVAISKFLDRETAKIDALIAEQERLIALLQEKRQAVISHAVTKGLDPNVPMKDSGRDWIGQIPAHWELSALRRTIRSTINGVWGEDPVDDGPSVRCIRAADFDRINWAANIENAPRRHIAQKDLESRVLCSGDLIIEKSGGGEQQPVGCVVLFDAVEPSVCSNFCARLQSADDCDPGFLVYAHAHLYSQRITTRSIKQSTGIQNLDMGNYLSEIIPLPPLAEQRDIRRSIASHLGTIDMGIDSAEAMIVLLRERRSALITAAVTGQIDVRGLVETA